MVELRGIEPLDLLNAIQALSQLSYSPTREKKISNSRYIVKESSSAAVDHHAHVEVGGLCRSRGQRNWVLFYRR